MVVFWHSCKLANNGNYSAISKNYVHTHSFKNNSYWTNQIMKKKARNIQKESMNIII